MNNHYDVLARYQYKEISEEDQDIIKTYLTDEELEYIIDYAIAPDTFLPYIKQPGFNIYYSNIYHTIHNKFATNNPLQVVEMVNFFTNKGYEIEDISNLLSVYSYDEMIYYIKNFSNKTLEFYPQLLDLNLSEEVTFGNYQPKQIKNISSFFNQEEELYLREEAAQQLGKMCDALSEETGVLCGGLQVKYALLSFGEVQEIYTELKENGASEEELELYYPGSTIYQLGTGIQFEYTGTVPFDDTTAGKWLKEHAYEYGFIQSYPIVEGEFSLPTHYRYYGVDIASKLQPQPSVRIGETTPDE